MLRYKNILSILVVACILFAATGSYALTVNYSYDDLHRLTVVSRSDGSSTTYQYDANGNRTLKSQTASDTTAPTVTINSTAPVATNISPIPVTVTFSESVTWSGTGILVTNGTVSGFSGSGTTYSFNVTPTANGTVTIDIPTNTVQDSAGNGNIAATPLSRTYDNTAPTLSISAPSATLTRGGPITYTITYSGADAVTLANANVTLNNAGGTATGTVAVSGTGNTTRTVTISSITGNGSLEISIAAGTASDTAGNTAIAAGPSTTFTVDNTAPTLSISAPSATLTKGGPITYTITYSGADAVTLANANVTLNNAGGTATGTVTVSGTGNTTRTVTISSITGNGSLGISVAAGTASDNVGNSALAAGPSTTFMVDNTAPVVSAGANQTKSAMFTQTGTATDTNSMTYQWTKQAGTGVITFGTSTALTTTITADTNGSYTLRLTATDAAGNIGYSEMTLTWDAGAPTVTSATSSTGNGYYKAGVGINITVNFSEAVTSTGLTINLNSGASITTGALSGVTSWSGTYTVGAGQTSADLSISSITGTITDAATNSTANPTIPAGQNIGDSKAIVVDTTVPVVSAGANQTKSAMFTQTGTATDTNSMTYQWTKQTGTGVITFGIPTALSTTVSADTNGSYTLRLTATDAAGNSAYSDMTLTWDTTAPTVSIGAPSAVLTKAGPITYTVTYTDANFNTSTLAVGNVTLNKTGTANGTIGVSGTSNTRTVTISSITGDGTLGISIAPNTGTDLAGNNAPAAGPSTTFTVDNTAPTTQDTVFTASVTKKGGATVTIASSGDATNSVWFAPAGTTIFTAGATMTTAGGTATSLLAPATAGSYKAYVIDASGNASSGSTATLIVDNTAPTAATTYSVAGPYRAGTAVTITATFNEAMADAPVPQISITGSNNLAATNMTKSSTTVYTYAYTAGAGNGTATVALSTGTDVAGNVVSSTPTSGATFTVDNTAPVVSAGPNQTKNAMFTQTATATDTNSMTYQWTKQTGTGVITFGTPTALSTTVSADTNGTYTLRLTATDAAGNSAYGDMTLTWDTTAPTLSIGAPSGTLTKAGPITYTINYSGADAVTLANVTLNKTGTVNGTAVVSGTGTATRTVTISSITGDGTMGISIASGTASDLAGNNAPAAGPSTTFTVDNTAPVVSAGSNQTKSAMFTQTGTATDTNSMTYQWTKQTGTGVITFGTPTALSTTITADTNGSYTLRLTATDAAGNSAYSDMTLTWDAGAPTVTITTPTSESTYTATITPLTVEGTASDTVGVSSVTWTNSLGGSGLCTGTTAWSCSISLTGGTNDVTITAHDAANNPGTDVLTVSYTLSDMTLEAVLDTTGLSWTTGGNSQWFGQASVSHDGVDAAQSGDIVNNQSTWMQTTVVGPATLSFWWKVSSEGSFDFLRFYMDGVEQTAGISGDVDWVEVNGINIPAGSHTLQWAYSKDGTVTSGLDAAWVDIVVFEPPQSNLIPYQPSGWSDKIVVSTATGSNTDSSPIYTTDTLYVNYAVINNGTAATPAMVKFAALYLDDTLIDECALASADIIQPNWYIFCTDIPLGNLTAGLHSLKIVADHMGAIAESSETDNEYTKTFMVFDSNFTSVALLTPNGGEKIMTGSTYQITWGAPATAVKFTLQYSINGGTAWKTIATNLTGNSYSWTVPAQTANKPNCLLKITGYNAVGSFVGTDTSNAVFRMEVIKLNSPNGGESWNSGTVHPITWTTGASIKPISKVNLYYKIDATGYKLITSFTGTNPGTYEWTVPTVTANKLASKVKVEFQYTGITAKGNDLNDANFTIKPAGAPTQNAANEAEESSEYLIQRLSATDTGIEVSVAVTNVADESLTKGNSTADGQMLVWAEPDSTAIGIGMKSGSSPEALTGEYLTAMYGEGIVTLNLDRTAHTIHDGHLTMTTDKGSYKGLVREDGSVFTITGAEDSSIFGIGMKKSAASLIEGTYRISEMLSDGKGVSVTTKEMSFDASGGYTLIDGTVTITGTYEPTAEGTFETSEGDTIVLSPDREVITINGPSDNGSMLIIGIKKK
ncbi:MAG: hypothetical protein HZA15_14290 [Nitrospirae bacterium]|nr:hypothetical protein [Nitrospirota bacterium]